VKAIATHVVCYSSTKGEERDHAFDVILREGNLEWRLVLHVTIRTMGIG
jgi:hypothetical protein